MARLPLDVGWLDGLVRKLGVPEVRPDEQAETQQDDWKTEQSADQLARHRRRPRDGTCFRFIRLHNVSYEENMVEMIAGSCNIRYHTTELSDSIVTSLNSTDCGIMSEIIARTFVCNL